MGWVKKNILYIAFTQALVATLGSLYFSEILHFPPCVLCWYQRICLYPLVFILGAGILRKDKGAHWYVLPLSIIGAIFALYHSLLYYHILPNSLAPCTSGVSCTTKFLEWFGFITIPLMSLATFVIIIFCMLIYRKVRK